MPLHWQEIKQGKQGLLLKAQDKEVAVCEPAIQETLVGSWEKVCEAEVIDEGLKDY